MLVVTIAAAVDVVGVCEPATIETDASAPPDDLVTESPSRLIIGRSLIEDDRERR